VPVQSPVDDIKDNVYRHIIRVSRQVSQAGTSLVDALLVAHAHLLDHPEDVEFRAWLSRVSLRIRGRFGHVEALQPVIALARGMEEGEFDMLSCIQKALDSLPHHVHAAYAAKDLEGLPWDKAAEGVGTTVAALRSKLPVARQKIREIMDACLGP
jgi:DNA-directed RNA polymerase specialized sigma24 family protein